MTFHCIALNVVLALGGFPTDRGDEPLPAGAVARFSSDPLLRIRHYPWYPQFSSNGKTIGFLSAEGHLVTIDPETGRVARRIRGPAPFSNFVLAADGRVAAATEPITDTIPPVAALRTWDLITGKERKLLATGLFQSLATDGQIVIANVMASKDHKRGFEAYRISDGTLLWAVEEPKKAYDGWLSTTEIALADYLSKPTADASLDVATGRIRKLDPPVEVPFPDWPDAIKFVARCYGHGTIIISDAKTGRETARIPAMYGPNCAAVVSPDGTRAVLAERTGPVHVFDGARKTEITRPAGHNEAIKTIAFTPDGRSLLSAGKDGMAFVWDVRSGKERRFLRYGPRESGPGPSYWKTALAPAGLRLAAPTHIPRGDNFETVTVVWDFATETELRAFAPIRLFCIALSPDGKTLATRDVDEFLANPLRGDVELWDVATGQRRSLHGQTGTSYASDGGVCAFTADGRLWLGVKPYPGAGRNVPVHHEVGAVEVWDTVTGRLLRQYELPFIAATPTPNGNALVGRVLVDDDQRIDRAAEFVVLEAATGLVRARFGRRPGVYTGIRATLHEAAATPFAASPDGRLVAEVRPGERPAGGGRSPEKTIVLWDATTGIELNEFTSPADVTCLAFAPDGRTLVSGGADGAILIWDVAAHLPQPVALAADEIERCWSALASADAAAAFRAMTKLANDPAALAKVRGRVKPAVAVSNDDLAKWARDLDSDQFNVRQRAATALSRAGRQAERVLHEAAEKGPSAEVRLQATSLLKTATSADLTGEPLADVRAVELLEWWGTAEARAALAELAKGAAGADSTKAAVAAVKRLNER